jgi:lysophospholipase L1-like esterase
MAIRVKSGETILFIGDSITDCGRRTSAYCLGDGYVKLFTDLLISREPEKKVTVINKGISGDRVTGLATRWQDDVLRNKPDWLSVKIGINDLHSSFAQTPDAVTPAKYREAYDLILSRTRKELPKCGILLITPFYISTEGCTDSWRRTVLNLLPQYIGIAQEMSRKYKTRLLNSHEVYQRILKHYDPDRLCPEPVHPNQTGHLALAEAVYAALSR